MLHVLLRALVDIPRLGGPFGVAWCRFRCFVRVEACCGGRRHEVGGLRLGFYGSGRLVAELVRQAIDSRHEVTAGIVHTPARAGQDLGALTVGTPIGVTTTHDLDAVLPSGAFDVLLYGGLIGPTQERVMEQAAAAGVDLVHAGFVDPEIGMTADARARLEEITARSGARNLGTGVNPGTILDVVPALLATLLPDPVRVTARRTSILSSWGTGVLEHELRIGQPAVGRAERYDAILLEVAGLLADALGIENRDVELGGGFIEATTTQEIGGLTVNPGGIAGFEQTVVCRDQDETRIEFSWLAVPHDGAGTDQPVTDIELVGPGGQVVQAQLRTPLDAYPGTASRMLKSLVPLRRLPPGIHLPTRVAIA
jgi:hypothetical protein